MRKLQESKLFSCIVPLIPVIAKALESTKPEEAVKFRTVMDAQVHKYGSINNLPIQDEEDIDMPEWYEFFLTTIADHITAKDLKRHDLSNMFTKLIVTYNAIKKVKPYDELIFTDITESMEDFDNFVLVDDYDRNIAEIENAAILDEDEEDIDIDDPQEESEDDVDSDDDEDNDND